MGIRVDEDSLCQPVGIGWLQGARRTCLSRKPYTTKELPYTIGGGIGQSRICMFFLRKAHIGEVQVSVWPQEDIDYAKSRGVIIL